MTRAVTASKPALSKHISAGLGIRTMHSLGIAGGDNPPFNRAGQPFAKECRVQKKRHCARFGVVRYRGAGCHWSLRCRVVVRRGV